MIMIPQRETLGTHTGLCRGCMIATKECGGGGYKHSHQVVPVPRTTKYDEYICGSWFPPPPLDSVTVTTSSENSASRNDDDDNGDDDSSSISCEVKGNVQPRSIFSTYWVSQGYDSCPFYRSVPQWKAPPSSISFPTFSDSTSLITSSSSTLNCSFDKEQPEHQDLDSSSFKLSPQRRSIFGSSCLGQKNKTSTNDDKSPTEDSSTNRGAAFRKTQSAPMLGRRSALRSSRFSGKPVASSTSNKKIPRSVSFSDVVLVKVLPVLPAFEEKWAADGWSNWFA